MTAQGGQDGEMAAIAPLRYDGDKGGDYTLLIVLDTPAFRVYIIKVPL